MSRLIKCGNQVLNQKSDPEVDRGGRSPREFHDHEQLERDLGGQAVAREWDLEWLVIVRSR